MPDAEKAAPAPALPALPALEDLPFATAELGRATIRSSRKLIADSVARAPLVKTTRELVALRSAQLKLRLFLSRQGEEVIFFFFRRQLKEVRPLVADLCVRLQAAPDDGRAASAPRQGPQPAAESSGAGKEECRYRLRVPPFLCLHPTDDELRRYAPPGTTRENGVLFRIGPDRSHVLGIRNPESGLRAAVVFTESEPRLLAQLLVQPFLELCEELRSFTEDSEPAAEVDFLPPTDPAQMTDADATLYWFVEAFRSIECAIKSEEAQPLPAEVALCMPRYAAEDYSAELALCLDKDGRFVPPKEEHPVSLRLRLTVAREGGVLTARLLLLPPDFLIAGALFSSFLEALRSALPEKEKLFAALGTDESDWTAFIDGAADSAVVFRTGTEAKSDTDTDAVVLSGMLSGAACTLVLLTEAQVGSACSSPTVKLQKIELCYDSRRSAEQILPGKTAEYFLRLCAAMKDWLKIVQ
jgi:hypothetical protein